MSPLQVLFRLLRSALNSCEVPPLPPDIDWAGVFDVACGHGVAAIAQDGLSRLMESNEECARGFDSPENENVKYEWFGLVFEVESQNRITSKRAGELSSFFLSKGFRCCVLKGQGLALLYPNPEHRQPGDIDLWVDGSRDDPFQSQLFLQSVYRQETCRLDFGSGRNSVLSVRFIGWLCPPVCRVQSGVLSVAFVPPSLFGRRGLEAGGGLLLYSEAFRQCPTSGGIFHNLLLRNGAFRIRNDVGA